MKYIFIFFLFLNSQFLFAQNNPYRVETITIDHGLFVNYAHAIIQDSIGFIWMGSDYGLQNYDAFLFKQYLHDPSDSLSLRSNSVIDLFTDREKNFWISTSGGLQRYQYQTDNFKSYYFKDKNQDTILIDLYALAQDSSGSLYTGINFAPESLYLKKKYISLEEYTNNGVFHFDPLKGEFTSLEFVNKILNSIPTKNIIKDISFDKNNLLWVALVPRGIFLFDLKNNTYKHFLSFPNNPTTLSNNSVNDIFVDSEGEVWISTEQGLNKFIPDDDSFIRYLNNPSNPNSLQKNNVLKVVENKYRELWVGYRSNYTGISRFNKQNEKFINYTENLFKKSRSLFIDNSGVVWLGSTNRGINVITEFPRKFNTHTIFKDKINLLQGFAISSIFEDTKGNTWFDGYPGGLYKYDRKTGQYTFYRTVLDKSDSHGSNWIKDIYEDRNGFIWFCTANALNRLDPQKHLFKNYQSNRIDTNTLPDEQISGCCVVNGIFWMITPIGDLIRFNPVNENFKSFHLGEPMHAITSDKDAVLWISSNSGVHKFDPKKEKFETIHNFKSTVSPYYGSNIIADISGTIWFTGNDGLTVYDPEMETIKTISEKDGLLSNMITAMEIDNSNNLWISSKRGLTKYNQQTGTFKNYNKTDGLRVNAFSFWSHYKNKQGEIYFGTFDGFVVFHPDSIKESDFIPNVILTYIDINNKEVKTTKDGLMKRSIFTTEEIVLDYDQNDIALTFASLDYTMSMENLFSWMLENYDLDWQPETTRYSTEYANLSPGEYVFKVKGSNSDGVWNEKPATLKIIILPPWWQTWWAYSSYLILLLILLYSLRRYELSRVNLKNKVILEATKLKEREQVDQMKSTFFTNISHEFRTPLTLILGPLNKLVARENSDNDKRSLQIMQRNAERLLRLINQLLDFSRLESGKMNLQASKSDIVSFVKGLLMSFQTYAEQKKIKYRFTTGHDKIDIYFDRDKMEKVIVNLLSNAFKFTPEHGGISVQIRQVEDSVIIIFEDSGVGIGEDKIDHIFDRFYQVDGSLTKDQEGTGIGLALTKELIELHQGKISVESVVGRGTKFAVMLPSGKDHLNADEIVAEDLMLTEDAKHQVAIDDVPASDSFMDNKSSKTIILVVEDNPDMHTYIRDTLHPDYQVKEAYDGEEGVELAKDIIPDLIISDLMMPKKDGYQLCSELKQDDRTSHIPVILLTAKAKHEDKLMGLQVGADDYLVKPFDSKELQIRIKNLIEIRRNLQAAFRNGNVQVNKVDDNKELINPVDQRFMERVMELVKVNLANEQFDIKQFSKEIGMSGTQLRRKMNALTGLSPNQFQRSIRLQEAGRLIREEQQGVSEAAYKVGFNSLSYFSKCFKEEFGYSPSNTLEQRGIVS